MESALIVSYSEKSTEFFSDFLRVVASMREVVKVKTCGEARRQLLSRDFDLIIINAPLSDETGEDLAKHIASRGESQVILVVKAEFFDEISAMCEPYGILTLAKPMNKSLFWSAFSLAKSALGGMRRMQAENTKLKQQINDIRLVNRAKCILVSHINMTEQEAHRYIEKQAMDMRSTRLEVASGIIKTYEN